MKIVIKPTRSWTHLVYADRRLVGRIVGSARERGRSTVDGYWFEDFRTGQVFGKKDPDMTVLAGGGYAYFADVVRAARRHFA